MIGLNPIGELAIGELSSDSPDVIINVGVSAIAVAANVPVVAAGAIVVAGSAKVIAVTTSVPLVVSNAVINAPTVTVAVVSSSAAVAISATVTVGGPKAVAVALNAPLIRTGASVASGAAKSVAVTTFAPVIATGKTVSPAAAVVTVTSPALSISISATVHPPVASVAASSAPALIVGGNYIDARNTITMNTLFGEVASASIGELAIGEGEPSTRTVLQSPFIVVMASAPFIAAGKTILPTAANVNVTSPRCEIDSRNRKLRILAIAS